MADPKCPECKGSGRSYRTGERCEVCQVPRRGPLRTYDARDVRLSMDGIDLSHLPSFAALAAYGPRCQGRKPGQPCPRCDAGEHLACVPMPEDYLFRVKCVADWPPGSGANWTGDATLPKNATRTYVLELLGPTADTIRAAVRRELIALGHAKHLAIQVTREDRKSFLAKEAVRLALEKARSESRGQA